MLFSAKKVIHGKRELKARQDSLTINDDFNHYALLWMINFMAVFSIL